MDMFLLLMLFYPQVNFNGFQQAHSFMNTHANTYNGKGYRGSLQKRKANVRQVVELY